MNKKEQALRELSEIENRQKELRRIIEEVETPKNIMDRVKTFEDACKELNIKQNVLIDSVSNCFFDDQISIIANLKLILIVRALNEGWIPDWNNSNEYKYHPYFSVVSGFGFSSTQTFCVSSDVIVGSHLCFKTRELATYAGKQFESIYRDYLVI